MAIYTASISFQVSVTNICPTAAVTTSAIGPFAYEILTSAPIVATFDEWTCSQSLCGTFTYSLTTKGGSPLEPFITFSPSTRTVTIQTSNPLDAGSYQYVLTGKLPT